MKTEKLFHRIRCLLRKAEDARGFAPEREQARRAAKRLMRKHKITEAELWADNDAFEQHPRAKIVRCSIDLTTGKDRRMAVNTVIMHRFPSVRIFQWSSRIRNNTGAMEFVSADNHIEDAAKLWKELDTILQQQWYTLNQSVAAIGQLRGWLLKDGIAALDEFSWLTGFVDGFVAAETLGRPLNPDEQESLHNRLEAQLERKALPAPPKKKRRCLPRYNPLALVCIPKRDVAAMPETKASISETLAPPSETKAPADETARLVHPASFNAGFSFGSKLAKRWQKKEIICQ